MFNFMLDKTLENDVYYYIENNPIRLSANLLAIKDNVILSKSNEWLYLLNRPYYPDKGPYKDIVKLFYIMNSIKNNSILIKEKVITFVTSFSYGTVHGYAGFFFILLEYLKNYEKYKDYKIIFLENSQNGIKQIFQNAVNKKLINKDKVIFIKPNQIYLIKELLIIPNKHHNIMGTKLADSIFDYIKKNFSHMRSIKNYERFNLSSDLNNVCIIKNNKTCNTNNDGSYNSDNLINFSKNNNVCILNPGKTHEVGIILAINTCTIFICSWGTAFMKNYCYISEKCKKIIVLVHQNKYLKEYNSHVERNILIKKFKNAHIIYKIRNDLNFIFDQ